MPETPWSVRDQGVLLLVDHVPQDYHQWVFLPGWHDAPIAIKRNARGASTTRGFTEDWIVLICNNTDCPARAAVRARNLEELAEAAIPVPAPSNSENV